MNIKIIACQIIGPAAAGSAGPVPMPLLYVHCECNTVCSQYYEAVTSNELIFFVILYYQIMGCCILSMTTSVLKSNVDVCLLLVFRMACNVGDCRCRIQCIVAYFVIALLLVNLSV